jgi:hypothetical protein
MDTQQIELTPEVIAALNEELDYQNRMAGSDRADARDNGVCGQVLTLETYVAKARDAWTLNKGDEAALAELRKCAAIAIRALVRYGCPRRVSS